MRDLGIILFGHKLSHLRFKIHVVLHLSHRTTNALSKYQLVRFKLSRLLKGMGDGTLIGLLHVTPKPHLRVIRLLQGNPF